MGAAGTQPPKLCQVAGAELGRRRGARPRAEPPPDAGAAARRAAPSRPGPAPLAPLKVCGRPCARPPDVWVIYCSGCQGEGRPYLPVRPEPSTTKSARELGGRTDGRSDAGPASPPPGLAAAAALAGLAPRRPGAPRRSGGCLTNRTWPRTCPPPPSTPVSECAPRAARAAPQVPPSWGPARPAPAPAPGGPGWPGAPGTGSRPGAARPPPP